MGTIDIIGKYDLKDKCFKNNNSDEGKSLAIATYNDITREESKKYDYIIYSNGSRVSDFSKDNKTIDDSKGHVDKIIDYFNKTNHNIKIRCIMLDNDAPLKEDGKIIAKYIEYIASLDDCRSVNIIGCSKSGVVHFDMIKNINEEFYKKINLYNAACPYKGTSIASPKFVKEQVKNYLKTLVPFKSMTEDITKKVMNFYNSISSNSHMDYDISYKNSLGAEYQNKYDSTLLDNIFSDDNLDSVSKLKSFKNFTTKIEKGTLKRALFTNNIIGVGMCFLNKKIMHNDSDGFVKYDSEIEVNKYLDVENIHIAGAHHDFLSDDKYNNVLLTEVDKNITEDKEKTKKIIYV